MTKAKFTLIDAGIIVVVLAVLAVGIKILKPDMFSSSKTQPVGFSVMVTNTDSGIGDIIKAGDEVSISFSEKAFAYVTSVEEVPHERKEFNSYKGKYETSTIDGKSDVIVNLECDATVTDTKISNGELAIRVGSEMPVSGKGYTLKGYVVKVEDE